MLSYYFFLKLERRLPTKLFVLLTVVDFLTVSGDNLPGKAIPVTASYTLSMLVECQEEHSMYAEAPMSNAAVS